MIVIQSDTEYPLPIWSTYYVYMYLCTLKNYKQCFGMYYHHILYNIKTLLTFIKDNKVPLSEVSDSKKCNFKQNVGLLK